MAVVVRGVGGPTLVKSAAGDGGIFAGDIGASNFNIFSAAARLNVDWRRLAASRAEVTIISAPRGVLWRMRK